MHKTTLAVAAAALALSMSACGGDDGDDEGGGGGGAIETWDGEPLQVYEVHIGAWKGSSSLMTVKCSSEGATIEVPGYTATIPRPESDGVTEVKVAADDGQEMSWGTDGSPAPYPDRVNEDDAMVWGNDILTNDELVDTNGLKFALNGVEISCAKT